MRRGPAHPVALATALARATAVAVATALTLAGCGTATRSQIPAALLKQMRPIGVGPRFRLTVTGHPTGTCAATPGTEEVHLELFAANEVLLIPAGVGHAGHCYGNAVTTDPTGTVHFRPGATLADVFRAWGQPLSATRIASFTGRVRYYVAGKRARQLPALTQHAEIVLEVGPYVSPHRSYSFPPGL